MNDRRESLPKFADRLRLGHRGLQVSPFCIGMVDDPATIPHAFDRGVNAFFVTVDMHWPLYEGTRRGLELLFQRKGIRDDVVVMGCCYTAQPEFGMAPFQELIDSVQGLERVDVLVAGGAYGPDARGRAERFRSQSLRNFVGSRGVGVSFHDRIAAAQLARTSCLDISFIRYNARHRGAVNDLFPHLIPPRENLVFNFKSTGGFVSESAAKRSQLDPDLWYPSLADHYRFVLTRPELDGILCAPRSPLEVDRIADALLEGPLDDEDEHHVAALCDAVSTLR